MIIPNRILLFYLNYKNHARRTCEILLKSIFIAGMKFKRPLNVLLLLLLTVFSALMIQLSLPYFTTRYDVDFLLTKQKIIHIKHWRYSFYTHITFSIFALIAGFTQFSKYLIQKKKIVHRLMGYIYVTDILLIAGPSGLIMSFYSNGTGVAKTSFILLSSLWMIFTGIALLRVRSGDFISHRNWMIRSYALTLSAISLRLYAFILPSLVHLNAHDEYALIAWLSWTINLLAAELIIYRKRNNLFA
jgi:hypothetical protein